MRTLFVFLTSALIFLAGFASVSLASDFETISQTYYYVDNPPATKTIHKIDIKNLNPTVYLKSYSLIFTESNISNINCLSNNQAIPCAKYVDNGQIHIKADFNDIVSGIHAVRNLEISYTDQSLAKTEGNTTDIFLPSQNQQDAQNTTVYLYVNKSLGDPIYFSQKATTTSTSSNYQIFRFDNTSLQKGIWTSFGNTQYYDFWITYQLPKNNKEIALPPDTTYQRVYLDTISPQPDSLYVDADGNWLASFDRNTSTVSATGKIQVFPKPRVDFVPILPTKYPKPTDRYWGIINPNLTQKVTELSGPSEINQFVVNWLTYDKNKINQPSIERLGADTVFVSPSSAVCSEYTDLFVAIAKAKGLSVAEINGFAMNEDQELEPTLIGKNILHAWPQYWNGSTWKQIDPTWEDTTGGRDYFTNFDLKHITFVIHGKDPIYPYPPTTYKVEYGKPFATATTSLKVRTQVAWSVLPFGISLEVSIRNTGHTALTNQDIVTSFSAENQTIAYLPPFATQNYKYYVSPKTMLQLMRQEPHVNISGQKFQPTEVKKQVTFVFLITLFIPIILFLGALLIFKRK